jgi:uncharacterized protein YndB with AHSA1/START domain
MSDPFLLEFRTELAAPMARVFAALTEGRGLERWFCDQAESELARGGRLVLRWTRPGSSGLPFAGRWVEFQPPWRCAFEGGNADYPDGYAGRVEFELADHEAGTELVTRHHLPGRLDYEPIAVRYRAAWPRALDRLAGSVVA